MNATAIATPLLRQVRWQDYELGIVYHFDLDVYMPGGHHHENSRLIPLDPNLYQPERLDTDQWMEAAVSMGARYAILTATHHQGVSRRIWISTQQGQRRNQRGAISVHAGVRADC